MQKTKILVTGANGQLGNKIKELLSDKYKLTLTDVAEMDITSKSQVLALLNKEKPDYIIHGAAYTKVDLAEDNKELCQKINILGTKNIAEAANEIEATVFYISTDYVFDGTKNAPYTELDAPLPLSVYGETKFQGEETIRQFCQKYYILRISWLFGELPTGSPGTNFIETILRLGKERSEISVVNDQIGSPTYAKDLVLVIDQIIEKKPEYGIYHFSGNGQCSWYDFAKKIFELAKISTRVNPINSANYPQKAKRPPYSYLSNEKIESTLDMKVRSWEEMVDEYIDLKR